MYRLVLCLRYLMSRWLTLVATGAVLLGVFMLLVVMAVMGGFVKEVRQACRGGLSDVVIESDVSGFPYYDDFIDRVRSHPNVAEATPVVQLFGIIRITAHRSTGYAGTLTRPCQVLGVRPSEITGVSRFREFLTRQKDVDHPTFQVRESVADQLRLVDKRVYPGCILGIELASYHVPEGAQKPDPDAPDTVLLCPEGEKVVITTLPIGSTGILGGGAFGAVNPTMRPYTVADFYTSHLYQIDDKAAFIPFNEAQKLGELGDPSGANPADPPRAHQIRVALHDSRHAKATIDDLQRVWETFKAGRPALEIVYLSFLTWEERRADILGAVNMEWAIMVIMLGLIVIVAGFLIGAVLAMIVKEKTRDIGILKSLGASSGGVARIFLAYAAVVSAAGAMLGYASARIFVYYIDSIEAFVSNVMDIEVFSRKVYYFDRIPRHEDPWEAAVVVACTILWAVLCATVAAWKAARLQPVEALRYE